MDIEAHCGEHINQYIERALAVAPVDCEFNGAKFTIQPGESVETIHARFQSIMDANAEAYRKSPEGIKAAKEREEWMKREAEKKARVSAMTLSMTVKPELADEYAAYVKLNSNSDYSKGVVDFGERWAGLMEIVISQLNDRSDAALTRYFVDNANKMSSEAAIDGLTGFMYGCAVAALSKFWVHGEPLRRWHNKDTQIGDEGDRANEEGGMLNPALLTIGGE